MNAEVASLELFPTAFIPMQFGERVGEGEKLIQTAFCFLFFLIFLKNVLFIFETERQSMSRGGAEREGDTESEAGSSLRAVSTEPDAGLEPTTCEIMT